MHYDIFLYIENTINSLEKIISIIYRYLDFKTVSIAEHIYFWLICMLNTVQNVIPRNKILKSFTLVFTISSG